MTKLVVDRIDRRVKYFLILNIQPVMLSLAHQRNKKIGKLKKDVAFGLELSQMLFIGKRELKENPEETSEPGTVVKPSEEHENENILQ